MAGRTAWLGLLLLLFCRPLWPQEGLQRFSFSHQQMGTRFQAILYAEDSLQARAAAQAAFARIDSLNAYLSDYLPDSELSLLSSTAGKAGWAPVSDELWAVLSLSLQIAEYSGGAFDPTIGPLSKLWRRAFRQGVFPDTSHLRQAREKVGFSKIQLQAGEQQLRLPAPGMRLDLGGIAKGYAVDEAVKVLQQHGVDRMLVDGGGDLYAGAPPPGKAGWRVAIEGGTTQLIARQALATSGDTYRYLEWEGRRYSHIIDPRTGLGVNHGLQVSVLGPTCALADALASALSVEPGLKKQLEERFPEVEIVIFSNEQE